MIVWSVSLVGTVEAGTAESVIGKTVCISTIDKDVCI